MLANILQIFLQLRIEKAKSEKKEKINIQTFDGVTCIQKILQNQ